MLRQERLATFSVVLRSLGAPRRPRANPEPHTVYSRSRYGGYDFAQNRKRVERWLFAVQEVAHA
jgi:hypothetical protein